jgi:hypothetical protein
MVIVRYSDQKTEIAIRTYGHILVIVGTKASAKSQARSRTTRTIQIASRRPASERHRPQKPRPVTRERIEALPRYRRSEHVQGMRHILQSAGDVSGDSGAQQAHGSVGSSYARGGGTRSNCSLQLVRGTSVLDMGILLESGPDAFYVLVLAVRSSTESRWNSSPFASTSLSDRRRMRSSRRFECGTR